jgi:hypothetical protein
MTAFGKLAAVPASRAKLLDAIAGVRNREEPGERPRNDYFRFKDTR